MCTTIGFEYKKGVVFGRTLELGVTLDNKILYVPKGAKDFIDAVGEKFDGKYSVLGSGFFNIPSFGDGMNEMGLMGSSNFFPKYASFAKEPIKGKINITTANSFDYFLSRCKNIEEVKEAANQMILVEHGEKEEDVSGSMHFFFMDAKGNKLVLEPKDGVFMQYDNPYGVLSNAPDFQWHATNLKNYVNLRAVNIEDVDFNGTTVSKFGEGTGMLGLPGDFTPPSRFIRAAYFVSNTPKDLVRSAGILQAFRILSQFDIPAGAVIDPKENHEDVALYTSVMDTDKKGYFIKCHENINIQSFYLDDFKDETGIKFIELQKDMNL